jgi:hypothetical protein
MRQKSAFMFSRGHRNWLGRRRHQDAVLTEFAALQFRARRTNAQWVLTRSVALGLVDYVRKRTESTRQVCASSDSGTIAVPDGLVNANGVAFLPFHPMAVRTRAGGLGFAFSVHGGRHGRTPASPNTTGDCDAHVPMVYDGHAAGFRRAAGYDAKRDGYVGVPVRDL